MRPEAVAPGDSVGERVIALTRGDLVRYAGASGDFNPIHWNERAARAAGLPGVIAHGMVVMGAAIQLVVDWAGDPGAVLDYAVRFSRPVRVPDPGAAAVTVRGVVTKVDKEAGTATVSLTVTADGVKALGKAVATVRLA
jgi:acyl dehydratase